MSRYDTMEEQINIRRAELNQRLIVLKSQQAQRAEAVDSYEKELSQVLEDLDRANGQKASLSKRKQPDRDGSGSGAPAGREKQQEFHAVNSRYGALKNISERYEGYGSSIKRGHGTEKVLSRHCRRCGGYY